MTYKIKNKNKNPLIDSEGFGGLERIRTAVLGFADRCLSHSATRPLQVKSKNNKFRKTVKKPTLF